MVRLIVNGCNGAMGRVVSEAAKNFADVEIAAGVDVNTEKRDNYPVFKALDECPGADVLIDFSTAKATDGVLDFCFRTKMPLVLCTTGLSEAQLKKVRELSLQTPVLRSSNMSLGINLLMKVLREAAPALAAAGFDIEILEKHHNRKVDAPSGTALAMADAINESLGNSYHYKYDRESSREKRDSLEIGIQSIRGGTIVGEHDVIFAGQDEIITFSHQAQSRAVFANGAIQAAKFLTGCGPGMYGMDDVIG